MHKLGAAAATPLPERHQRQLGDGQGGGPRARLRAKLQRNPADAVADALLAHPLHGNRITTISWLLKSDQGDAVIPAEPSEIGPDLALAQGLQQAIASEIKNLFHSHFANHACHINTVHSLDV